MNWKFLSNVTLLVPMVLLAGCDKSTFLKTDEHPAQYTIGGKEFAIPKNYLASGTKADIGSDVVLVVASWPEMEGRPASGPDFTHYSQSNIRILTLPGSTPEEAMSILDAAYKVRVLTPARAGPEWTPPEPIGEEFGYQHLIRQHTKREMVGGFSGSSSTDIYIRKDKQGRTVALMLCDGEPSQAGRSAQCSLQTIYPEFPQIVFKIGFHRSELLPQVNAIEEAVRDKFVEFMHA